MLKQHRTLYLLLLSFSHLVNDAYSLIVTSILPVLTVLFNLTYFQVTLLVTSSTLVNLVSGPVLGYMSDRLDKRWFLALSLALSALCMSFIGFAWNLSVIFVLVMLGRVGASVFHPLASKIILKYDNRDRAKTMAVFQSAGTFGRALAPILVGTLVSFFALRGITLLLIPGLIASLALFFVAPPSNHKSLPETSLSSSEKVRTKSQKSGYKSFRMIPLLLLSLVVFARSCAEVGMRTFIPLYFTDRGNSLVVATFYVSAMMMSGIGGELVGGALSDKYGRKPLIAVSMIATTPLLYLFLYTDTPASFIAIVLYGLINTLSTTSFLILAADFTPKHVGFASGLIWSLISGSGGVLMGAFGLLADKMGLLITLNILALLPLIAGIIALALPKR